MVDIQITLPIQTMILEVEGLSVAKEKNAYEQLELCAKSYYKKYAAQGKASPSDVEGIQAARTLYRALGIDPTKTRPSSEALLRRALNNKLLYCINTLVDVCNWCSLDFLLPIGLYDKAKINGSVKLRQGEEGESYEGIGKPNVNVAGRYVLADETGPFGSPTSDSLRTCISTETTAALMVIFAPNDYSEEELKKNGAAAAERMQAICNGKIARQEVVRG